MKNFPVIFLTTFLFFFACSKEEIKTNTYTDKPLLTDNPKEEKSYVKNGRTYLWGGRDSSTHFDITGWLLKVEQLNYGLGREAFKALIEPEYMPVTDNRIKLIDDVKCLFVRGDNNLVKIFPYEYMLPYEAVNEEIDGEPIMIAYCVLADLAAAYTRIYCDQELTFAVSGYTYYDQNVWGGLNGFILWDRDTESLWWPLIDKGVSGSMINVPLEKHNETKWGYIKWGEVGSTYPQALVLVPGQSMARPKDWLKIPESELNCQY